MTPLRRFTHLATTLVEKLPGRPMNRRKRVFAILLASLISLLTYACRGAQDDMPRRNMQTQEVNSIRNDLHLAQGGTVSVYEDTLQLKTADYLLPPGWWINQKIAIDTQNASNFFQYYLLEFLGPRGELISHFAPTSFNKVLGGSLQQEWGRILEESVGAFGSFQVGQIVESELGRRLLMNSLGNQNLLRNFRILEVSIDSNRNGQSWQGKSIIFLSAGSIDSFFNGITILSPQGTLGHTLSIYEQIEQRKTVNPVFTQRFGEIRQRLMAGYVLDSQNAYRQRASAFQAAQRNIQAMSVARSQSAAAYSQSLSDWAVAGAASSSPAYTSQDQYNDHLKGTTTFQDPYTGYQIPQPGEFERWFTDSLGNYVGTDNPNFDPASLDGSWESIAPLSP